MIDRKYETLEVSDEAFVEGVSSRSDHLLNKLYKTHYPMVLQLIIANNGSEQDAKDIYQEAFIILYDKISSGSFVLTSKLKTFIYSVSRRLWLKKLYASSRHVLKIKEYEEVMSVDEDIEFYERKEEKHFMVKGSLEKLGEPCKTILEDFYVHNRSMVDISEKFGYTNAENAKNQKYKCLMRLKKIFFSEFLNENKNGSE